MFLQLGIYVKVSLNIYVDLNLPCCLLRGCYVPLIFALGEGVKREAGWRVEAKINNVYC